MHENRIEVKEIKKEPECTAIHSSYKVKKDSNKVYHRRYKKFKRINTAKNMITGIVTSFLLAEYGWIVTDSMLKYAIGIAGWAVMAALVLNEVDKFIYYLTGGER
ncbi:hypothetical protein [uncultured Eubacterium sp.]|uniref:hypothetical protein n=1 Tax=uncultured Eubacterium sp. TaxID=165185 RepID=UPI0026733B81|nr:hypothetical protein [uncultured Eubacterium sp.]